MMAREWFSPSELAAMALPMLPNSTRGIQMVADREEWHRPSWRDRRWRERGGRGGGLEYHFSLLPASAQVKLAKEHAQVDETAEREQAKRAMSREDMWAWFEGLPDKKRNEAKRRLEILDAVRAVVAERMGKAFAVQQIASHFGVTVATIYNWERLVAIQPRHDWLPWLAPRHSGRTETVECDAEAWEMLKSDYLRPEKPTFLSCFRRLERTAAERGWTIPSQRTLQRRIDDVPAALLVLSRDGTEAASRLFPAQRRDRGGFHALEAVNADGHKWDVFVKWPDGTVNRPMMCAFQDLYSGMIVSWRVDKTANKEAVRLAFGDMVEAHGIPDHCWLDNGRDFASKWLTGGTPNRYRFKVKDDDPPGIMTQLGVQIHWTTPYHGQSKPIERAFRDMAGDVAKHPRFAGAYVGNNPTAKPENYGSAAVPLEIFLSTLHEEIASHNARTGRKAATCNGRSFKETFDASYAEAPIKKATAEQRRLWLLAAEGIKTSKENGEIALLGNRYWSETMLGLINQKVIVRFDPAKLHAPLHVYRLDGAYAGVAPCVENVGFADVSAAQEIARQRGSFLKGKKMQLKAERSLTAAQVAALLPEPEEEAPAPETKVVRPVFGNTALKPFQQINDEEDEDPAEARVRAARAQAFGGRRSLRVVTDETGE